MTILLVDIGNTRLKWATSHANTLQYGGAFTYRGKHWPTLLNDAWQNQTAPTRVIISNVTTMQIAQEIKIWVSQHWPQATIEFPLADAKAEGLINGYEHPAKMGMDRWFALIAAWKRVQHAFLMIGCGTCITADVIDATGKHLGSFIAPGLRLLPESVVQRANIESVITLPATDAQLQHCILGNSTESAVHRGTLVMAVAFIHHVQKQFSDELNKNLKCFITGGDAPLLLPHLNSEFEHTPYLVLEGLQHYAHRL